MAKAYSYVRMSTREQLKGDSLRRQLEDSRAYAERNGLDLDETLKDIGLSAYSGRNRQEGALSKFLALIEAGKVEAGSFLLVEDLDRLSREEVLDALDLFLGIIRAGISVVTLKDNIVYSRKTIQNDYTRLIVSLTYMSRAHEDSKLKGIRVSQAWHAKQRRAELDKMPLTQKCPGWLRLDHKLGKYVIIEERAEIVRRIFCDSIAGIGRRAIAAALNREGVRPFGKASGWQDSYIQKLLHNLAVLGIYEPHTNRKGEKRHPSGPPIDGYYPPIIDENIFYLASSASAKRQTGAAGRKGTGYKNLFHGIVKCECGGTMRYLDKGQSPKGGRYFACDSSLRGLGCHNNRHWRYQLIEDAVLDGLIREIDLSAVAESDLSEAKRISSELEATHAAIATKRKQANSLLDAFGDSTEPLVIERIKRLGQEIRQLEVREIELSRLDTEIGRKVATADERRSTVESLASQMAEAEDNELYRLRASLSQEIRSAISFIVFSPDTLMVVPKDGPTYIWRQDDGHWTAVALAKSLGGRFVRLAHKKNAAI